MNTIPTLHVGQAMPVGPVTLFPVWADVRPVPGLVTGLAGKLRVTEVEDGPAVNFLSVYNPGTRPVLVLEGELFEGGWQTRAAHRDTLIRPGEEVPVEVVCVEQGRWGGEQRFERRSRRATNSVRRAMQDPHAQSAVWADLQRWEALGATASGSIGDHLDRVTRVVPPRPLAGQNGVIVGVAGQPVALEVFGNRPALTPHLLGIVEAAMLEAALAGVAARVPARRARRFAEAVESTDWHASAAGVGRAWTGRSDRLTLRALTVGPQLAHLTAVTA